ncbi:MAG: formate--tetrahydrofolate ligase, partial [Clostridia bacterium]|nr:formate--tetrahydrofolate ligase [Clostridia bacterium]
DYADLKKRLARIVVAYDYSGKPVTCGDLKAQGAMCALLKDALKPNLAQTLEGTPAIIHGGPFANIAHGCNSVIATKVAMSVSDYTITEAGFGADLGAEKFFDIKCRYAGLKPDAVVVVATIRALKMHGGVDKKALDGENVPALIKGIPNLLRHVSNVKNVYKLPVTVAVNRFPTDTQNEIDALIFECAKLGVKAILADGWAKGGAGMTELAEEVVRLCEQPNDFEFCYQLDASLKDKINAVVTKVYGGDGVIYSTQADKRISELTQLGYGDLPVCMAKTQYSFSDDPKLLGAPEGFTVTVKNVRLSAGAGFVVVLTGDIMTMPGLPKRPAAENIDVDDQGNIYGLF